MNIAENKYHSTIKVEFRNLIDSMVNGGRVSFHMYTVHRLLSLGLLIDFPFRYVSMEEGSNVRIELDLKNTGKAFFVINSGTDYATIADEDSKEVLCRFLQNFSTACDTKTTRSRKFFNN